MHLQYMALQSIHYDMFRYNNAIYRKYIPSLKPFIAKLITVMNFMSNICLLACDAVLTGK